MGKKLGIDSISQDNINLLQDYLKILDSNSIDFTLSFRDLSKILNKTKILRIQFLKIRRFQEGIKDWRIKIIPEKTNLKILQGKWT